MSDFTRPQARKVIAVRPLVKGMFRDRGTQAIEDGGFLSLKNVTVTPTGIRRRPAFLSIANDESPVDRPIDAQTWVTSSGSVIETLITESLVYDLSRLSGLTLKALTYTTGTAASADGDTITGTSTVWKNAAGSDWDEVRPGDYFALDSVGTLVRISAVNSATEIELASTYPTTTFDTAVDDDYTIYRGFRVRGTEYLVDTVAANNRMLFLSPYLPPTEIATGGTSLEYLQDSSGDATIESAHFTARTGAFFEERLYLGGMHEYDGAAYQELHQRVRYSTTTDFGQFEGTGTGYIDLDYTNGPILAIRTMGNLLAVYLQDAIYLGQGTPDVNNPLKFDQVETGGIGLVGQKAVVPYKDGHFFVGQDNIYYLSPRGLEPVGTPILQDSIESCDQLWRVYAVMDTKRHRVVFGFPRSDRFMEILWSFDYRTGAWSYEEYPTYMIAALLFDNNLSWNDLSTYTWNTINTLAPTWDDLRGEGTVEKDFIREFGQILQIASDSAPSDDIDGDIEIILESKDHDLDAPDLEKAVTRLAVKLQFTDGEAFDSALDFTCEVSQNRGRTWKNVGRLRIRAGEDEGHCDFRLVGSTFRFRLTSSAAVPPYFITEYTFSVTPISNESHLGSQQGV